MAPRCGEHVERFAELAERNGYSPHIARSMKFNRHQVSYDKDPKTGEITWYPDTSGKFVLSDDRSNLCFNASNAEHCGFSKGTADTVEELAATLDLKEWKEMSDYGRQIAAEWQQTAEAAEEQIRRWLLRYNYWKSGSGDRKEIVGSRITIIKKLLQWWDRAPNIARMSLPPKETLEYELRELKKEMADIRKAERRR